MKLNFLTKNLDQPDFIPRAVAVAAIGAAAVALGLLFWRLSIFLPLVFATIVIAVAWRGAAESVGARLGIAPGLSLLAVALALVVGVAMAMMAFGGQLRAGRGAAFLHVGVRRAFRGHGRGAGGAGDRGAERGL